MTENDQVSESSSSTEDIAELRALLVAAKKEKYLEPLMKINIVSPSDLVQANEEELHAVVPKMIARILQKKAAALQQGPAAPVDSNEPSFQVALTNDQIKQIRQIWRGLRTASCSFGARFYEVLIGMDKDAIKYFPGVDLVVLGRDFDEEMDLFVDELDDSSVFYHHRDEFVKRLVRYKLSLRTLWLAADAFEFAAVSLCPEMDLARNFGVWVIFFRSIIPPFHPHLLKSTSFLTVTESKSRINELSALVQRELARRGFLFYSVWLRDHPDFFSSLEKAVIALYDWQSGSGRWSFFVSACGTIMPGMQLEEIQLKLLCAEIPDIVSEFMGEEYGSKLTNSLLVIGGTLHGIDKLNQAIRESQKEIVSDTWDYIYRRTSKEFGERFYNQFTKDPKIARIFKRTNFAMQREHFVHQFNVILLRINEDVDSVLRPLLIELGARHRLHYLVGIEEMVGVMEPLLETMREMLGTTNWTNRTADAWAFCTSIILRFMIVGWTCGVGIIDQKDAVLQHAPTASKLSKAANITLLRDFRDASPEIFSHFFRSFAGNVDTENSEAAAVRYQKTIDRVLDETDISVSMDRLHALGSRHVRHHGVTLDALSSAASAWMSTADIVFGSKFTVDVALEWARLWVMIATSMLPNYMGDKSCPTVEELFAPFRAHEIGDRALSTPAKISRQACMTLKKKSVLHGGVANLFFDCDIPVQHRAGQYAKIRFELPDGRKVSRYYSIASCPDQVSGTTTSLEICVKEVPDGRLSPFLVRKIEPPSSCDLVMTAGHFVLSESGQVNRLMVSGGIGIVAFIGVVRSVVAQRQAGLLKHKTVLTLVHCERSLPFTFMDELLAFSKKFSGGTDDMFLFDFTLCATRTSEEELQHLSKDNPCVSFLSSRLDERILSTSLSKFSDSSNTDVYLCGPGGFQKAVRNHLIQKIGHSKKLVHQEFFDL